MFGLDNLINLLFDSALEKLSRNERVIQTLKRLNLNPDHPPADFIGVYQYALVEYGIDKPRYVLEVFRQSQIQQLFRTALEQNNPTALLQQGEAFLQEHALGAEIQANAVDMRREFYEFAALFIAVAKRTRTPAEILAEQKLESLHHQLITLHDRLNRLPTLEGVRTEMARLALPSADPTPPPHSPTPQHPTPSPTLFALAQQMRGWFETLGYRFESYEIWQADHFEWIINIPVRRGRYDRILIRGMDGEAGLADVNALRRSLAAQRADEGWLVTARRISRAARDEVEKPENNALGCYTLDELLDQDADFSGYLTWLEQEIQQRGISEKYVPLACTKEEFDPDTKQRIGVSHYGDRDGWIDGYLDLWLDDPAKEHISILGEFGTGKTWFALHYAWNTLQRYRDAQRRGVERPRLPLVIPLRDYAKAVSVESLFSEFFFRKHEIPIPGYTAFEQLNRMGKLLLIFDGFDEMAARVDRQQMINNFWELAKVVVPGAKVILTCRTEHFPEAREGRALLNAELQASTRELTGETPQFEVLELEKFNDDQIRQVLSHQAQAATVAQIMGNPQLLDLARRPVLTELILEALPDIEAGKPVDMSRVYLYAVRHKMERDIKAERTFTSMADKLYFLCELSWEMLSTDRMSINYREFPDRIRKLFGSAVQEERDLDHWHYDMMGQTMLIRNAAGDYTPAHRSLIEFFVAYKFAAELGILSSDFKPYSNLLQTKETVDSFYLFGGFQLTKALTELMLPMLEPIEKTKTILLEIIRNKNIGKDSKYAPGNAMNLLLSLNPVALERQDLSEIQIIGVNLTRAKLRAANLSNSEIIDPILPQSIGNIYSSDISCHRKFLAIGEANGDIQIYSILKDYKIRHSLVLQGHSDSVSVLKFSPDENLLFSGSHDHKIRIWDINSGECIQVLEGHTDYVHTISIDRTGSLLASGGRDKVIRVWDVSSGYLMREMRGHDSSIQILIFCSYDETLVSGSKDNTIKIWNYVTGECIKILEDHTDSISALAFLGEEILASGSNDKTIRVWNTKTETCLHVLTGHQDTVNFVVKNPLTDTQNQKSIISGSRDGTLMLWNLDNGAGKILLQDRVPYWTISMAACCPNNLLFTSGESSAKLWNLEDLRCLYFLQGQANYVLSVNVSSDGQYLVSGDSMGTITIWDFSTGKSVKSLQADSPWVQSVSYAPSDKKIASLCRNNLLQIWNIETGECQGSYSAIGGWHQSLAFRTDGKTIVGGNDSTIKIWDIDTGECIETLQGHKKRVQALAISHDESLLGSAGADGDIKIWDLNFGTCLKTLRGHSSQVWSLTIDTRRSLVASASSDKTLRFWNLDSGECIKTHVEDARVFCVVFSPDGHLLAQASGDSIRLWNAESLEPLKLLGRHEGLIIAICFSPNGKTLITGSLDETIKFWDVESGVCMKTLSNKPYSDMNITGVKGLTESEKTTLKVLGAIES